MREIQQDRQSLDVIDLQQLLKLILRRKLFIIVTTLVFTAVSVTYALSLPNVYKSEVTLSPVAESSNSGLSGQLGGLAALAGANLGNKANDKVGLAVEVLGSRDFIGKFIEENDLYIPIMAAEGWDRASDTLIIDPEIYDVDSNQWLRDVPPPFKPKPSRLETTIEFKKLFSVNNSKATGIVSLGIEHYSPYLAQEWAEKLVRTINEYMRQRDLKEAEQSIAFLNQQVSKTNLSDARTMLFALIEEQTKTLMLANVRSEYVFKVIDPPVVAELKAKPQRALIVSSGFALGFILSLIIVFIRASIARART